MNTKLITILLLSIGLGELSAASRRPLLFPNPERPGPHPLEQVREQMLARFDANRDGFLDKAEREKIRLSTKKEANDRMARFLKSRENPKEVKGSRNPPPERWLKLYDKNRNKIFDGGEWDVAFQSEVGRVTAHYDKNADGQLNSSERKIAATDSSDRKKHGYDRYILRVVGGIEGQKSSSPEERWRRFDRDRDGKASLAELRALRNHEAGQGGPNAK